MVLFEVLITNMMLICGANNNSSIKYLPFILGEKVLKLGFLGVWDRITRMTSEYLMHKLLFEPQMNSIFVISTLINPIINKIYAWTKAGKLTGVAPPPPRTPDH